MDIESWGGNVLFTLITAGILTIIVIINDVIRGK